MNSAPQKRSYYNTQEYEFKPEPISEGGIVFSNFPGYGDGKYKSMRIFISQYGEYGIIGDDVMDKWKNNNKILCDKGETIDTFLKSFDGAPLWTIEELTIFEKCFNTIGFKRKDVYPKKTDLSRDMNIPMLFL
jgi:hypothetical protein